MNFLRKTQPSLQNYFNVEKHVKNVFNQSLKIRQENSCLDNTSKYLHDLFDFFLDDMKNFGDQLYEEFLIKKHEGILKYTATELRTFIINEIKKIIPHYESVINGYNFGSMFREYSKLQEDYNNFKLEAEEKSKKLGDLYYYQYCSLIKKNRQDLWMFVFTAVAAITGIILLMSEISVKKENSHLKSRVNYNLTRSSSAADSTLKCNSIIIQ